MKFSLSSPEISFNQVLLLPQKSKYNIGDDHKIDLKTKVSKNITLDIPLLSSPMPNVTEVNMAIALGKAGGMGFIHPFQNFNQQLSQVSHVHQQKIKVAGTIINLNQTGLTHAHNLLKVGADLICIETAHAHNLQTINFIKKLKDKHPQIQICASLIVTSKAAKDLILAGADSLKIGVGGGSHCTTRSVTGVGRPQLSALNDCYQIAKKHQVPIISDTGIKQSGDIAKALVFGASTVMIGGLLAGFNQSPGKIINQNGRKYKLSSGMCTQESQSFVFQPQPKFQQNFSTLKYLLNKFIQKSQPPHLLEEGIDKLIPFKGDVDPYIKQLISSLKRSFWYQGSTNISNLRQKAQVILTAPQNQHGKF